MATDFATWQNLYDAQEAPGMFIDKLDISVKYCFCDHIHTLTIFLYNNVVFMNYY